MYGHHQSKKLFVAMNSMNRTIYLGALVALSAMQATAQEMNQQKYQLADERQLWSESRNAAGLAHDMQDSTDNRGVAYFDLQHQSGDYHRVQEGNQQNQLRFFTERYQKIGKRLVGYGSFDFDMGRIKERAWSDVMRTYNSNPFISGHIKYYLMTGVDYAKGNVGDYAGYQREYVNHEFGGELSYGVRSGNVAGVTALTLRHGTEYAYGQYKYEPGTYYTYHYGATSRWTVTAGTLLHSISASLDYEQAYADEYNSQLITEKDGAYTTQRWERTMTFKKRYQLKKADLALHYRLSFTADDAVKGFVGASYDLQSVSNKHLLATSQLEYGSSLFGLEGGYGLLNGSLWVKAHADYHLKSKADLDLHFEDGDYAVNVLQPDMEYYGANWWRGRLEVTYQLPVTIKKQRTLWFAKVYGSYLKTDNSLDSKHAGIAVGVYY